MFGEVELVVDAKAVLGEGPTWDQKSRKIYWVDIEGEKIHIHDPHSGENRVIETGQMVGAIAPRATGGAIVAMENGLFFLNLESETFDPISDPETDLPENRFNDGKCDPYGRFWAGTLNKNGKQGQASLYCLEPDLTLTRKLDSLSISNGLAWSPDHKYMYFIDTPTGKVQRFKYDLESGKIEQPNVIIDFEEEEGFPDGMTIDAEGYLWIAHWGGGKVTRWNPESGEKVDEIQVPAVNVTCCVFGGETMEDLYITTARTGTEERELERFPYAGGLFKVKTAIKGAPSFEFLG